MSRANYYVYYRVEPEQNAALRRAVKELFESMARQSGVRGALMRRHDDPTTWMEVYEGVVQAREFADLLATEAARLGLQRYLAPGTVRHVEAFVALED